MIYVPENYVRGDSPTLDAYVVDLDQTLAASGEYEMGKPYAIGPPIAEMVESVQRAYLAGKVIIIYTARSWFDLRIIANWLRDFGVPYDTIVCGKPSGFIVDDRNIMPEEFVRLSQTPEGLVG